MNSYKSSPAVVTSLSIVANEAFELARISRDGASGARTIVSNSRKLDRGALIAGRVVRKLVRDCLQLARVTLIYGREARIPVRRAFQVARVQFIAGRDCRISASNGLIRDRVSIIVVRVERVRGSITLNFATIVLRLGTPTFIGDTFAHKSARLGLIFVSIALIAGRISRIPVTS